MTNINRPLGNGFGPDYDFPIFLKEDIYKPLINEVNQIEELRATILTNQTDRKELVKHLPDLLVDLDIDRLAKFLSGIMGELDDKTKELFSDETVLEKLDSRFLKTLAMAIAEKERPQTIKEWSAFLSKEKISQVDPYLLAYLIPAILDQMNQASFTLTAAQIIQRLDRRHFKAITIPNYFDIQFNDQPQKLMLKNNGRTLIFRPETAMKSTVVFRNKIWELDHTHIHLEGANEEREYRFYDTRTQYEATKNTSEDPSLAIVGEIHSVYKRVTKKDHKVKYMAIAVPLKLGKQNADFQAILDQVKAEKIEIQANGGVEIATPILFHDVFMKGFTSSEVIYHSWGSLKSDTFAFKDSGLRFNIVNKPISISKEQYQVFKCLFGELQELNAENLLYPIDRKANYRKIKPF